MNEKRWAYTHARHVRNILVNHVKRLPRVHSTTYIHVTARVARDLQAAEYAFVATGCSLQPQVSIGRYSMLAPGVTVVGADHRTDVSGIPMQFAGRPAVKATKIEDDVWIGAHAIIRQGVTIARGAIVGAGAVLVDDVGPYEVWAGVPAHRIGCRFSDTATREYHDGVLNGPLTKPNFAGTLY